MAPKGRHDMDRTRSDWVGCIIVNVQLFTSCAHTQLSVSFGVSYVLLELPCPWHVLPHLTWGHAHPSNVWACVLDAHPSNVLACQIDEGQGRGSHGLSAKCTKDDVKRHKGPPTRSQGPEGPKTSSICLIVYYAVHLYTLYTFVKYISMILL